MRHLCGRRATLKFSREHGDGKVERVGILGIRNRTENWRTARTFAPFLSDAELRLVLAEKLGEPSGTKPEDVQLELFWKGMRDYIHKVEEGRLTGKELANEYCALFPNLRKEVNRFSGNEGRIRLETPHGWNYQVSRPTALSDNLKNTEIDIVLQTKDRLFIGEAKDESGFHADGSLVLVHQLIRQYVVASILVELTSCAKEVVPFIVRKKPSGREPAQVQFMLGQGWLKRGNILTWGDIEKLMA